MMLEIFQVLIVTQNYFSSLVVQETQHVIPNANKHSKNSRNNKIVSFLTAQKTKQNWSFDPSIVVQANSSWKSRKMKSFLLIVLWVTKILDAKDVETK